MKIFLDSANIEQIKTAYDMGAITGVTTNPSIISRENRKFDDLLTDITAIMTDGPVFAEVLSVDAEGMIEEGRKLAAKSKNIVVKIPMIPEGLKAVKTLSSEGITVCNTVVFSSCQAILAANAGASYVAPFVGRMDDIGGLDSTLLPKSARSSTLRASTPRSLPLPSVIPFTLPSLPEWAPTLPPCPSRLLCRWLPTPTPPEPLKASSRTGKRFLNNQSTKIKRGLTTSPLFCL